MNKIFLLVLLALSVIYSQAQIEKSVKEVKGLKVGMQAPNFKAMDAHNSIFQLQEALQKGPVVLIFYRGFWCPVCNKHLASLQDSLQMIESHGAQVIAISPEKPEYLKKMADKTGANFTLLHDDGYKIADAFDVNYKPSSMQTMTYNLFLNADLKESHSDESQNLPIPATFIIDKEGKIIWRHFDPDYHERSTVNDILKALE